MGGASSSSRSQSGRQMSRDPTSTSVGGSPLQVAVDRAHGGVGEVAPGCPVGCDRQHAGPGEPRVAPFDPCDGRVGHRQVEPRRDEGAPGDAAVTGVRLRQQQGQGAARGVAEHVQWGLRGQPLVQGRQERLGTGDVGRRCEGVAGHVHLAAGGVGEVGDQGPVLGLDAVDERAAVQVHERTGARRGIRARPHRHHLAAAERLGGEAPREPVGGGCRGQGVGHAAQPRLVRAVALLCGWCAGSRAPPRSASSSPAQRCHAQTGTAGSRVSASATACCSSVSSQVWSTSSPLR